MMMMMMVEVMTAMMQVGDGPRRNAPPRLPVPPSKGAEARYRGYRDGVRR